MKEEGQTRSEEGDQLTLALDPRIEPRNFWQVTVHQEGPGVQKVLQVNTPHPGRMCAPILDASYPHSPVRHFYVSSKILTEKNHHEMNSGQTNNEQKKEEVITYQNNCKQRRQWHLRPSRWLFSFFF